MANVKKGQLTAAPQWWRHLKDYKPVFWSAERRAVKEMISDELLEIEECNTKARKRVRKRFGMEYRVTEEHYQMCYADRRSVLNDLFPNPREWKKYWSWYETAKQRDQAMERFSRQKFLDYHISHEYRPIKR